MGFGRSRFAADDFDFIGDHESCIKANAKLADKLSTLFAFFGLLGLFDPVHEGARARTRNRSEIFDHLLLGHADAVIGNRQSASVFIRLDNNFELTAFRD